ncbi:PREDICTED: FAS-associated death domain protein-like [Nicrophorus vespilloides]|uniref:FAS-associated death domain protein-like n=1 Tax=Nicrophorus vespilloides TaxID=110193 RepID=A0ABM1MH55_NICVS|nr:PREDICTED: FAS-associated death domain protein-like [Nicrophorus vespilloides]
MANEKEMLALLKIKYENVINSKRKLSSVNNGTDLINLLKRRDALTDEDKIEIENILQPKKQRSAPLTIASNNYRREINTYQLSSEPSSNIHKAYEIMCNRLGKNWKDFARELKVSESKIDELGALKHNEAIQWILTNHENNCDKKRQRHELINALSNCRRKDLSREVDLLMSY